MLVQHGYTVREKPEKIYKIIFSLKNTCIFLYSDIITLVKANLKFHFFLLGGSREKDKYPR